MVEPRSFGRYEIIERLGRGGMGVVYRASDPVLQREVAVKVLSPDLIVDTKARARFNREGRALAALQHPNVTTVHEFGEQDGAPFLVIEFLPGSDLEQRMSAGSPLTLDQKLDILIQVCAGLSAAHDAGITHFDVKPANISLMPDGRVKLLDFGIARAPSSSTTVTSVLMGTPSYMSPEQLSFGNAEADHRADIFALGVVAYELLAGRRPFEGPSATAVMLHVLNDNPTELGVLVPGLPPRLAAVVARALEKTPERRYQTAREFAADISAIRARLLSSGDTPDGTAAVPHEEPAQPAAVKQTTTPLAPDKRLYRRLAGAGLAVVTIAIVVAFTLSQNATPRDGATESGAGVTPSPPAAVPASNLPETRKDPEAPSSQIALRVESNPAGARITIGERRTDLVTPATVNVPRANATRVVLEHTGFRPSAHVLTRQQLERGVLRAKLESIARSAVSIEGPYEFEVWNESDTRISGVAMRHSLALPQQSVVILRSAAYLLEERLQVGTGDLSHKVQAPGRLQLRFADDLARCPMTIARLGSGRAPSRHFTDHRQGIVVPLAPGEYRIEVVCAGGLRASVNAKVPSGELRTARITPEPVQ